MKKILLLSFLITFIGQSFAQKAAKPVEKTSVELRLDSLEQKVTAQAGIIDSLLEVSSGNIAIIKTPVSDERGAKNLLGAIIGLVSLFITYFLFKVTKVKEWVDEKWSKAGFTLAVGGLISAIFIAVVAITSHVGLGQSFVWLISAWGTHFSMFTMFLKGSDTPVAPKVDPVATA